MNTDLIHRIKQCPTLPSLPSIAMQVLDLAAKADVDIAEIARIISKDAALSGKILRTVNSSFYGRSQHVSTISHALVILGLQSVKTLVLGFSLVTNLSQSKSKGFKHLTYWRRSIFGATAARTIAKKLNLVEQEEAFLAALLQDIGMLVLDQVLGAKYGDVYASAANHAALVQSEQAALEMTHADVGTILAEQWKLPPVLAVPIGSSHHPETVSDASLKRLSEVVQLSGLCADVYMDEQAAGAIANVRNTCAARYKWSVQEADQLLEDIGQKTKEVASLFEINIGSAGSFESILKKANEALVELTLQSQQQATQLQEQNSVLRKKATIDALTGLNNRSSFDDFLAEHFPAANTAANALTLLLMDVDKFKSVNDKFGHQAGDAVLRHLGKLLRAAARAHDLPARYGGEELAMILPKTSRSTGTAIAETIRRAVAAKPFECEGVQVPITISIGVACVEGDGIFKEATHLLKAADMAVYAAKNGGRNCVKVFALKKAA